MARFFEIFDVEKEEKVGINVDHIVSIEKLGGGSIIYLDNKKTYVVMESVQQMIDLFDDDDD